MPGEVLSPLRGRKPEAGGKGIGKKLSKPEKGMGFSVTRDCESVLPSHGKTKWTQAKKASGKKGEKKIWKNA